MRIMFLVLALHLPVASGAAQQRVTEPVPTGSARGMVFQPAGGQPWHALHYPSGAAAPPAVGASDAFERPGVLEVDTARTWSITGAVVGAVVGAAIGGALGCLANRDDYGVYCGGQSDTKVVIGAVLGAGAGAWIGAVLPRRMR